MKNFLIIFVAFFSFIQISSAQWWKDTVWTQKTDQVMGFGTIKFSNNDSLIVGNGLEMNLFFDAKTGNEVKRITGYNEVFFLNNDKNFIKLNNDGRTFEIFDAKTYKVIDSLETDEITTIKYSNQTISKDNKYIAIKINNGFRIWNIETKKIEWTKVFPNEKNLTEVMCNKILFNCDNSKIYVRLWRKYHDPSTPDKPEYYTTKLQTIIYDFSTKDSINIIPNNYVFLSNKCKYMILGVSGTNGIEIHDAESRELLFTLPLNILTVSGLEFSPDDKYLVTASSNNEYGMTIWDMATGKEHFHYNNGATYTNIDLSNDGKFIVFSIGNDLYLFKAYFRNSSSGLPEDSLQLIYPNPTTGEIKLKFILKDSGQTVIDITDLSGKTIKTVYDNFLNSGEQNFPLNISWLPPGSYFLTIRNQSTKITLKLIIQR